MMIRSIRRSFHRVGPRLAPFLAAFGLALASAGVVQADTPLLANTSLDDAQRCQALIAVFKDARLTQVYHLPPLPEPEAALKIYDKRIQELTNALPAEDAFAAQGKMLTKAEEISADISARGEPARQQHYGEARTCIQRTQ